jgi:hypothetical protein
MSKWDDLSSSLTSSSVLVNQTAINQRSINEFKGEKNHMYGKSAESEKAATYAGGENNNTTAPVSMPSSSGGAYRVQSLLNQMTREHYIILSLLIITGIYMWKR